ncbi:hypothetical protein G3O08_05615 [Cryomorpha ignava]|uniref:UDP-N-acetylmuramoyl-L-alanine--D-glutamate ligase n=1 Tax=Cryomorpha ignava TaxID=101383 RepID=A0A7K3WMV8_9FLAO|nr:hypothetical protein [Cryomorpha ignava]NEN22976.1 hypothetical protein [Cryomorpha ignava]
MSENRINKTTSSKANPLLESRLRSLQAAKPFCLEFCGRINGVTFINDSAATSIEKVADALISFDEPVIWIAEVSAPNTDFSIISDLMKSKVKGVVAVGEFGDDLHKALMRQAGIFVAANTWDEALDMSLILGKANDKVLFSPGSRAIEPFENYKERGAYWNRLVSILQNNNN